MGASLPKQYLTLSGRPLADHTLERLLAFSPLKRVVVALSPQDPHWPALALSGHARVDTVVGGASRSESVRAAVAQVLQLGGDKAWVLVHDMARPLVRQQDMQQLLDSCGAHGAILARPVVDTIKQAAPGNTIATTLDRRHIWRALTPQLFPARALHDALCAEPGGLTDEASALEQQGWAPQLVEGHGDNIKITVPEDLPLARFYLQQQETGQ